MPVDDARETGSNEMFRYVSRGVEYCTTSGEMPGEWAGKGLPVPIKMDAEGGTAAFAPAWKGVGAALGSESSWTRT